MPEQTGPEQGNLAAEGLSREHAGTGVHLTGWPVYGRYMSKVVYFTACTLDGFIADEHNSLDWLFETPHSEDESSWDEFIGAVGPYVHGPHDIRMDARTSSRPSHRSRAMGVVLWRPPCLCSHTGRTSHGRGRGHPLRARRRPARVDEMRSRRDGDVWIIGGGDLVEQFDDAGLLDRGILGVCPVTLGAGAPLLPRRITSERMRVTDVRQEAQQVRIVLYLDRRSSCGSPELAGVIVRPSRRGSGHGGR